MAKLSGRRRWPGLEPPRWPGALLSVPTDPAGSAPAYDPGFRLPGESWGPRGRWLARAADTVWGTAEPAEMGPVGPGGDGVGGVSS